MKLKELKIVLADDDIDDCIFFQEAVEELLPSSHVITKHDGEQLMQFLNDPTTHLPNIVFLDINMPRKNGFECLTEIKQNKKLKEVPIIMFSTSFEQEVVNQLYENGAFYFIRKPSEFSSFKKIIKHTLMLFTSETITPPTRENFVLVDVK